MSHGSLWRVFAPALIISFGGVFNGGYQGIVVNPGQETFTNFINSSYYAHTGSFFSSSQWAYVWPTVVNTQVMGSFLGSLFIGFVLDYLGSKKGFYLTHLILLVACTLQIISKFIDSWEAFVIGRSLIGISQGIQTGLQPVYFNDISPKSKRGLIGSLTSIILDLSYFVGAILALPVILGNKTYWPVLFIIEACPTVLSLILLFFLPESPKYLASRGDYVKARDSLRFFGRSVEETDKEMEEIRQELNLGSPSPFKSSMPIKKIFTTPYIRKGLFLGLMVSFSATFSGTVTLSMFSTSILQSVGVKPEIAQYATIGQMGISFLATVIGGLIIDQFGRRPLILSAQILLLLLNVLFIIFGHFTRVGGVVWTSYASVIVTILIFLVAGLGLSNAVYFLTVELVPPKARSSAQMVLMTFFRISMTAASFIVFPLQMAIQEYAFLLHIVALGISIVFIAWALPETKNKSSVEILRELGYKEECDAEEDGVNEKSPLLK